MINLKYELESVVTDRTNELRKLNRKLIKELGKRKSSRKLLRKSMVEYKSLYTYLQKVREDERITIARHIQDDLAQLITTLRIELITSKEKTDKLG